MHALGAVVCPCAGRIFPEARNGKSSKEWFEMQIKTVLDTPAAVEHLTAERKQGRKKSFYNDGRAS